jgi:hypothetical protein
MEFIDDKKPELNPEANSGWGFSVDPLKSVEWLSAATRFSGEEWLFAASLAGTNEVRTEILPNGKIDRFSGGSVLTNLPGEIDLALDLGNGKILETADDRRILKYAIAACNTPYSVETIAIEELLKANYNDKLTDRTELPVAVVEGVTQAGREIGRFFLRHDRLERLQAVFGNGLSNESIEAALGKIAALPKLEILSEAILGDARGAFDGTNNKIYLSSHLVMSGNVEEITDVIIEEIGHFLDRQFNGGLDSPGDEGEIFSKLVRNIDISADNFQESIREDDRTEISLNGQTIEVERSVSSPIYAIKANGFVTFNGKSDLDGNPFDLSDDAFIYAEKGLTLNGNTTLPVQRNSSGTALTNS